MEMDILRWMNRTIKLSKSLTTPEMHPKAPLDFFVCNSLSPKKSPSKYSKKNIFPKQIFLQKKSPSKIQPPKKKVQLHFTQILPTKFCSDNQVLHPQLRCQPKSVWDLRAQLVVSMAGGDVANGKGWKIVGEHRFLWPLGSWVFTSIWG